MQDAFLRDRISRLEILIEEKYRSISRLICLAGRQGPLSQRSGGGRLELAKSFGPFTLDRESYDLLSSILYPQSPIFISIGVATAGPLGKRSLPARMQDRNEVR